MKSVSMRAAAISAALALLMTLGACNKTPDEPAPITDPAEQPAPEEAAPPAESEPEPVEPEPVPVPKPIPKPKPKPKPAPVAEAAPPPPAPPVCYDCGTISNIETVKQKGQGSGAGAVAGGVAGGVVGHQFGGGRGKDAATAFGAIAGAVAGHMIEKNVRSTKSYDVTVTMEAGGTRVINVPELNGLGVGQAVRVDGNNIQLR